MQHGLTRGSPNVCWRGRCWDVFRSLVARYLWGQAFAQVNLCLQICFQTGSLLLRHADLWHIFLYSILVSVRNVKYLAAQSLAASRRMCCWPRSTSSPGMGWALTLQSVLEKHWTPWCCRKCTLGQGPPLLHTEKTKCEIDAKGSSSRSQFWVLRKQESPSCSCPSTSSALLSSGMHFNIFFRH